MLGQKGVRKTGGFAAEDKHVTARKARSEIRLLGFLREQPESLVGQGGLEFCPIIDDLPRKSFPVIEPRSAQVIIIDPKTEWPHKPQFRAHRDARSPDAAGI